MLDHGLILRFLSQMRQGMDVVSDKSIAGHPFLIRSVLDPSFLIGSGGHFSHLYPETLVPEFCRFLIQVSYTTKKPVHWRCRSLLTRLPVILEEAVPKSCLTCHSLISRGKIMPIEDQLYFPVLWLSVHDPREEKYNPQYYKCRHQSIKLLTVEQVWCRRENDTSQGWSYGP